MLQWKALHRQNVADEQCYRDKTSQRKNVTTDKMLGGHSMRVKVSIGRFVGGRFIKAPYWTILGECARSYDPNHAKAFTAQCPDSGTHFSGAHG
jgi:hypothetical protein